MNYRTVTNENTSFLLEPLSQYFSEETNACQSTILLGMPNSHPSPIIGSKGLAEIC